MKLFKISIAFFFLFIYSLAFAVELVPHYHNDSDNSILGITENFNGHTHIEVENRDSDDISHENHLDDNLLDFVICLLQKIEHSESDIFHQYYFSSEPTNIASIDFFRTKLIAIPFVEQIAEKQLTPKPDFKYVTIGNYLLPTVKASPHRGPPVFSC